jgi:hypothetical protein
MSELARIESRDVEQFDPARYRITQAALNYGIDEAKRIKDWPQLEEAVDHKIAEQLKFVAWWTMNVRRPEETLVQNSPLSAVADNGKGAEGD